MKTSADIARVAVLGTFKPRTRSAVAAEEALAAIELLGMVAAVDEVLPGPPTAKVVRVRMKTPQAVNILAQRMRDFPIVIELTLSNMWCTTARTPSEMMRTAPIARAVRSLNTHLKELGQAGVQAKWSVEGSYRPGEEAICVSLDTWRSEHRLMAREDHAWRMDQAVYEMTCRLAGRHGSRLSCDADQGPKALPRPLQGRVLSRAAKATEGSELVVDSSAGAPNSTHHHQPGCTVMTLEASNIKPLLAAFAAQHHPLCMCMMLSVTVQHFLQHPRCMIRLQAGHHGCILWRLQHLLFLESNSSRTVSMASSAVSTWLKDQPRTYSSLLKLCPWQIWESSHGTSKAKRR